MKNSLQVWYSYYLSLHFERFTAPALPISIAFEPTTSCNLRCPECPSGLRSFTRATGMLDVDFFKEKIIEMKSHLAYLTFYFQGEPYLHPQFLEMVDFAASHRIYTATSTNAHYLNDAQAKATILSGLHRLIISIDGTTQETYQQYRVGGQLNKVLEGTKNLVKWKKKFKHGPMLIFQFLVVAPNEHQIQEAKDLADDIGVDAIEFKTAQIYDYENGSELIPKQSKYSRYRKGSNGKFALKSKMSNQCWKMWHSCVITWDGKVVPCCFDKDATHVMGDLKKQSFKEIWQGEKYNQFRRQLLTARSSIDICKNCSEGLNVSLTDG